MFPTIHNDSYEYENYCPEVSIDGIPDACHDFIQFDNILQFAFTDPDPFVSSFCKGECAKPLYDYFKECDKVSKNSTAPTLDLMCTSNPEGKECVKMMSDAFVQQTHFNTCISLDTSDQCPTGCSAALQRITDDYGCCHYSLFILFGNEDETLLDKCSLKTPGLCKKGGISGDVIDAPGGKVYDDDTGDASAPGGKVHDDDTGDVSAFKASVTIVFTVLLLGTI